MSPTKRKATSWFKNPHPGAPATSLGSPSTCHDLFVACPTCGKSFSRVFIDDHAWSCQVQSQRAEPRKVRRLSAFVECPTCTRSFPKHVIEKHAWECQVPPEVTTDRPRREQQTGSTQHSSPYCLTPHRNKPEGCLEDKDAESRIKKCKAQISQQIEDSSSSKVTMKRRLADPPSHVEDWDGDVAEPGEVTHEQDAMQRLMEGGKRAVRAERAARRVPPEWPVEVIEEVLPSEQDDELLRAMLRVSRSWTSYPWYNNTGVEGRSHTRSRVYRLRCQAEDGDASDPSSSAEARDSFPAGELPRRRTGMPPGGRVVRRTHDAGVDNPQFDDLDDEGSSRWDEPDGESEDGLHGGEGSASTAMKEVFNWGSLGPGSKCQRVEDTKEGAVASGEPMPSRSRQETYEEFALALDRQPDLAPPELLAIVPRVVDLVRRSHIGAHSDSLSNIGPQAVVAALSLGAKRVFTVQESVPWGTKQPNAADLSSGKIKFLDMPHNSMVVMWGGCQERYKHAVPPQRRGVGAHPVAGTKRISITLRERRDSLPPQLLPIPSCRCGVLASLKARVLAGGAPADVEYYYQCDRGQGQCGFMLPKARLGTRGLSSYLGANRTAIEKKAAESDTIRMLALAKRKAT